MSYASCDWSVTVFISGYANAVVTSQHVSQSYFIKEIENGFPVFVYPDANTRESLVEFESIYYTQTLACGSGSHTGKLSNSSNSLLCLHQAI